MTEPSRKFWRPKASHLTALFLALGATLWVASGVVTGNVPEAPKSMEAQAEETVPEVRVILSVAEERLREVVLFGRTEAVDAADIAAETSGRVVKKAVEKGAWVKKGQVLLQLAMDDRKARLAEAEAKVKFQEIAFNAAQRLSKKQFQSRVRLAEKEAELETAKANLAVIKLDIARTAIRAPIAGFVDDLPMSVGDYVTAGQVVSRVVDLDPLRIVGQVAEKDVARIRQGEKARALLADGRMVEGEVRYVSRTGSEETRTFRVDVWVDNPDGALAEGLTTEMHLPAESETAHLVSPAVLTLDDEGVVGIKAVNADGRVQFHPVRIVADTAKGIWLGGLPERLTVITVGQEYVQPGQKVRTSDNGNGEDEAVEAREDQSS